MEKAVLRSKHGCWTCRLRKKKCDERRPQCSTCDSLTITCYGYGPKPEWKDDVEAERAILKKLSETVRKNARLKIRDQSSLIRDHASGILASTPKSEADSTRLALSETSKSIGTGTGKHQQQSNISLYGDSKLKHGQKLDSGNAQLELQEDMASRDRGTQNVLVSARDSVMLMHFLDSVFPIQYPMYQPRPSDGGRGWLLALLFESRPFRHSALALSSYSRLLWTGSTVSSRCRNHVGVRVEQHLEVCLQQVRQTVRDVSQVSSSCQEFDVGTILAVVQLIFIELCTSKDDSWRMHLRGAIELYRLAVTEDAEHDSLNGPPLAEAFNLGVASEANGYVIKASSMRFACASLIWLDTVGSITEGREPQLMLSYASDLDNSSTMRLEGIMGCRNGTIVQIARVTGLYSRTKGGLIQESDIRLRKEIHEIGAKLELEQTMGATSSSEARRTQDKLPDRISIITSFFTCAARIYLHLVTSGFEDVRALETIVSPFLIQLETKVEEDLYPTLVCPLFFLGCVISKEHDLMLLRKIFTSPSLVHPLFAHRDKLLPVLEKIWKRNQEMKFSWTDVVKLASDILLV